MASAIRTTWMSQAPVHERSAERERGSQLKESQHSSGPRRRSPGPGLDNLELELGNGAPFELTHSALTLVSAPWSSWSSYVSGTSWTDTIELDLARLWVAE
jgi:hypothetical protein